MTSQLEDLFFLPSEIDEPTFDLFLLNLVERDRFYYYNLGQGWNFSGQELLFAERFCAEEAKADPTR